jgi:hypothetical protein
VITIPAAQVCGTDQQGFLHHEIILRAGMEGYFFPGPF